MLLKSAIQMTRTSTLIVLTYRTNNSLLSFFMIVYNILLKKSVIFDFILCTFHSDHFTVYY